MINEGLVSFIIIVIIFLILLTLPLSHHSKKRLFDRLNTIDTNWSNLFFKTYFFSKIIERLYKNSVERPVIVTSVILILINRKLFEKYNDQEIDRELKLIKKTLFIQSSLMFLIALSVIFLNIH